MRFDPGDCNLLPEIFIMCTADHGIGLVMSIVCKTGLVATSAILATLSLKSPSNFNKAKSISYAAFWSPHCTFFPTYFVLQNKQKADIAETVNLTAYIILMCLFGPIIKIIVLFWKKPRKNTLSSKSCEIDDRPSSEVVMEKQETRLSNSSKRVHSTDLKLQVIKYILKYQGLSAGDNN